MISSLWNAVIYQPLYNILVFLIGILPGASVGGAIIVLTIIVKLVLFPLTGRFASFNFSTIRSSDTSSNTGNKDDRQKQSKKTMELYQKTGVSPFSGCLPIIVQIPIIIGLYWVFWKGLATVDESILYGFIQSPGTLDMHFLFFDLAGKSVVLAFLAGISQYIQTRISMGGQPPPPPPKEGGKPSLQDDFARSMQMQMRYILPVMIAFFAYTTSGAVALYWTTSNILSIAQELLMQKKRKTDVSGAKNI